MKKKLKARFLGLKLNVKLTLVTIIFIMVPIVAFSWFLFDNMENNTIHDRKNAMKYSMDSSYNQVRMNVDSVNMSTQFFLSDNALKDFLIKQKFGEEISAQELMEFNRVDIASLERVVNTNPYLYQIRVYVDNDTVQEMMPIVYRKSRMERLEWADDTDPTGWKFNYTDTIFDSFVLNQNQKILSLITPMSEYRYGKIGFLEVAMKMETMFPILYEETENEWNFFVDSAGNIYDNDCGEDLREVLKSAMSKIHNIYGEDGIYVLKIDSEPYLVGVKPMKEIDGSLISVHSMKEDIGRIHGIRNQFGIAAILILIVLMVVIDYIVRRLLRQFYIILQQIREVQTKDLDVVIPDFGNNEMGEMADQINKMLDRIKQLMADNINREVLVKNSEIRALQNQINAHFIYNVLESIKMMAEIDEEYEISDAITCLGKLLRYSMKWTSGNVTVEKEIEYIQNYLVLINLRFDYEIYLSLNIPEEIMNQEIPKMSLQPIVENAIYHGIEQMAEDTNIYIKGINGNNNDFAIEVTDAGRGMSEEELDNLRRKLAGEIETSGGSGNGIGLKNVQDRIKMSFGEKYGLEISSKLGCYTKVMIRIPLTKQLKGKEDKG